MAHTAHRAASALKRGGQELVLGRIAAGLDFLAQNDEPEPLPARDLALAAQFAGLDEDYPIAQGEAGGAADPLHALAVLGEEFGELTKAMLQLTYEPHKNSAAEVRSEAVQTAAMALRLLASLDVYEYRPGVQHAQNAGLEVGSAS